MTEVADTDYYETVEIHDRDFQRYSIENEIYFVPVDLEEETRLDLQHQIFFYVLGQKHFEPDIGSPQRILDCGYGQGSWVTQMANDFPDSEVVAYDIYPVDLTDGPENITAQIWDLNDRLRLSDGEEPYDFVHSRCVGAGIKKSRWDSYIRDLKYLLRPGGWVQLAEYYLNFQSDSGRLIEGQHYLRRWSQMYLKVMDEHLDRDPRIGRKLADKLRSQRFRHVRSRQYHIPIGVWHEDAMQQRIGYSNIQNVSEMLESHAIWPFTNTGPQSWSAQDVRNCNAWARQEIQDTSLKPYVVLYVAWGQR